MRFPDKVYDILKWVALVCIPALATFYVACGAVWGWPYTEEISKTANAVIVLIGALIGVSTAQYNKEARLR